ncbi:unnamed protein product, partial [Mesorhabditis belari]|uniref:Uncharacterized protein n=1 Tax=Mesorhabditis belari TaxID=2138241 RepID=A0AAF3EQA3_9BILA
MNSSLQSRYVYLSCFLGFTANGFLLYFILTDKSKSHNGYKRILGIITLYNLYYGLVHAVTDMVKIL